jgi:hypothetical protein
MKPTVAAVGFSFEGTMKFDVTAEADEIEKLVQPMLDRGVSEERVAAALFVLAGALASQSSPMQRQKFADAMRGEASKLSKAVAG